MIMFPLIFGERRDFFSSAFQTKPSLYGKNKKKDNLLCFFFFIRKEFHKHDSLVLNKSVLTLSQA